MPTSGFQNSLRRKALRSEVWQARESRCVPLDARSSGSVAEMLRSGCILVSLMRCGTEAAIYLIGMVNIMFLNSAIRFGVVASLLVSTSIAGSQPRVAECALKARAHLARGAHSCGCKEAGKACCCGKNCKCARVPEDRDTNRGIPATSVQRVEPWSHATVRVQFVAASVDSLESGLLTTGVAVRNHSLVCMGTRLNC